LLHGPSQARFDALPTTFYLVFPPAGCRSEAAARSIFRAHWFGRWVV